MNRLLKNLYVILLTVVLLLGAAFVAETEDRADPYFQIENEYGKQDIRIYDARDTNWYVFLPSYAGLEQVRVILPEGQKYMLGDVPLSGNMTCEGFDLKKPYDLSVDGEYRATLWFYQSRNVAAMYIETVSGEMTEIHRDKNYEEYAAMTLYTPDGSINHFDGAGRLKGRGNSTWEVDKRPYLLSLSEAGDLLDMGSAKKWVLLANAYDEINLNNKLVFDLAAQVGIEWAPDSQFVDLYLNGEYNGLYLLSEKVEVHPNRLNIDSADGDFLCKIDLPRRWDSMQNPFLTAMGRTIEVNYPKELTNEDAERISFLVNVLEEAICSEEDLETYTVFDMDSWIRRYLIDEISGNIDADLTSSYFYFADGRFSAGPIWDYDKAFGNHYRNQEPCAFLAKNAKKWADSSPSYYSILYANESYYQRMVEIYRTEFVPALQNMIHRELDIQVERIQAASEMNTIRWYAMYNGWMDDTPGTVQTVAEMKSYITKRIQFLNSAWLENADYCTVQFETKPGKAYWNISVEKGTCLDTTYMDLIDTVWVDKQTGLPVDFQKPIVRDMTVEKQIAAEPPAAEVYEQQEVERTAESMSEEERKELLCTGVFILVFLGIFAADVLRRTGPKQ